jgi:chaperone modulatory protein CbpM
MNCDKGSPCSKSVSHATFQVEQVGETWCFSALAIQRARRMHHVERDFDAVPKLAALMADLLEEMDGMRARLRKAGLG